MDAIAPVAAGREADGDVAIAFDRLGAGELHVGIEAVGGALEARIVDESLQCRSGDHGDDGHDRDGHHEFDQGEAVV
ncbi:hypothetical protein D3C85_1262270 [compost metagenome]